MPFFLLGRGTADDLRLLSPALLPTRQDALAELSRLTSDPAFDDWDLDVMVVDLDAGIPVLLVRPASNTEAAAVSTDSEVGSAVAASLVIDPDEAFADTESLDVETIVVEEPEGVVVAEIESALADQTRGPSSEFAPDAPEVESVEELPHSEDDIAIAAVITSFAPESPEEASPDAELSAPEPPAVAEIEADSGVAEPVTDFPEPVAEPVGVAPAEVDLRDALQRTTEQMEASGIIAPESVGPVSSISEPSESTAVMEEAEAAEVYSDATAEQAALDDARAASDDEVPAVPVVPTAENDVPAWPWDVATEAEAVVEPPVEVSTETGFLGIDDLEESTSEMGSLVRLTDEGEVASETRPVILGAYDEPAASPQPYEAPLEIAEPMSLGADVASLDDIAAPAPPEVVLSVVPAVGEAERDELSDFILDLGSVTGVPESVPAPGADAGPVSDVLGQEASADAPPQSSSEEASMDAYTCEDCVYVETCPNKGQKLPKDCISFQWK